MFPHGVLIPEMFNKCALYEVGIAMNLFNLIFDRISSDPLTTL